MATIIQAKIIKVPSEMTTQQSHTACVNPKRLSRRWLKRAYPKTPAELRVNHAKEKWRKAR